jgi:Cu(I)/Ag(I) efflux system membrane fusion protein
MARTVIAGAAILAVLASAVAGYRFGAGTWPTLPQFFPASVQGIAAGGRDNTPVHEDEEPGFRHAKPAKLQAGRKILYYRNPMGLADVSPAPRKDSMGMDYIPVYEGDEEDGSTVKIAPGKLQRTGVKSEPVSRRILAALVHAPGVVQADEHRQAVVALRFDAFVNELEHITTGSKVRKGEPLMRVYS